VRLTEGNAPFQLMPGVGSVLRGYSTARYVGADLVALQAEYRVVPLFWRLGLVGFLGAAQVAPSISEFSLAEVKYMIGVGARVQLSRRDAINIRWDFGFGLKSSGDYLDLGEAFQMPVMSAGRHRVERKGEEAESVDRITVAGPSEGTSGTSH
jgi:hypothetical protein